MQSRLAEELGMGKIAMGGLIDRREKSGSLRRQADATNHRIRRVLVEPKIKALITRLCQVGSKMTDLFSRAGEKRRSS